jgi:hypothetical protein
VDGGNKKERKMKKKLLVLVMALMLVSPAYAVDEWLKGQPAGTINPGTIGTVIQVNNEALDRFLAYGRFGCAMRTDTVAQFTVDAGSVVCSNAAGTVRRTRVNTSATTVTFANLDVGSEASSTTYYVYSTSDTDVTTFAIKISLSSSAPSGVTYYKKLGYIYNDANSNITNIVNENITPTANTLGAWATKSNNTVYLAATDGFVCSGGVTGVAVSGYSDASNPPTTRRASNTPVSGNPGSITFPVKRGDYWKVVHSGTPEFVYWLPSGS